MPRHKHFDIQLSFSILCLAFQVISNAVCKDIIKVESCNVIIKISVPFYRKIIFFFQKNYKEDQNDLIHQKKTLKVDYHYYFLAENNLFFKVLALLSDNENFKLSLTFHIWCCLLETRTLGNMHPRSNLQIIYNIKH